MKERERERERKRKRKNIKKDNVRFGRWIPKLGAGYPSTVTNNLKREKIHLHI
jgi:hypothetical protein